MSCSGVSGEPLFLGGVPPRTPDLTPVSCGGFVSFPEVEIALGTSEKDLSAVAELLEKSRLKAAPTEEERFWEFDAF